VVKSGGSKCCYVVVAGILVQEILKPDVFWYNAGLPENLPGINFGGPDGKVSASRTTLQVACAFRIQRNLQTVHVKPLSACELSEEASDCIRAGRKKNHTSARLSTSSG